MRTLPRLRPVLAQVHRVRDLPQLLVEDAPDLLARRRIGGGEHHGDAEGERAHQPEHQVRADRSQSMQRDAVADAAHVADELGRELAPQVVQVHLDLLQPTSSPQP